MRNIVIKQVIKYFEDRDIDKIYSFYFYTVTCEYWADQYSRGITSTGIN